MNQGNKMILLSAVIGLMMLTWSSLTWAAATFEKDGDEFRVNTSQSGHQRSGVVTGLSTGGFAAAWTDDSNESSDWGIFSQLFSSNGARSGPEIQVNTTEYGRQSQPAIATVSGGYVVAFTGDSDIDGDGEGIVGQLYDSYGNPEGTEFIINTFTENNQSQPAIAPLAGDKFVVAWSSSWQDGGGEGVFMQIMDTYAQKISEEIQVNSRNSGDSYSPDVAALNSGNFVVVWMSYNRDAGDADGVYGQMFNRDGETVGEVFRANSWTSGEQSWPAVAALSGGGFVVVWISANQDGSDYGIFGQRYNSSGEPVGEEFQVNTYTSNEQSFPDVAPLSDGGFLVAYNSRGRQFLSESSIYAQRFNASGEMVGNEFLVNTTTADDQTGVKLASLGAGSLVAIWGSQNQDNDGDGIYGQLFTYTDADEGGDDPGDDPTVDPDLTPVQQFVARFYVNCLERQPDEVGLAYWVDSLEDGTRTGSDVARSFIHSQEFQNRGTSDSEYVTILYKAFFGRDPDSGGFTGWMNQLAAGASRDEVLDGFIYAQEFVNLCRDYGITPYTATAAVEEPDQTDPPVEQPSSPPELIDP